jgi:hypothetical protein
MQKRDIAVVGLIALGAGALSFCDARGQVVYDTYPMITPTYPTSGVYSSGENVGVYTNGESVTNFGGVIFLGDRKSCGRIGNSFICN